MTSRTAILAGATGLVGGHCVHPLLERYDRLVVLGRRIALSPAEGLSQHIVDFDHLDRNPELLHGDDFFCCLGTTLRDAGSTGAFRRIDHDYVVELARLALDGGVRRGFVVTALGADPDSRVFYNRVKGELEEALGAMSFEALHIVRPSLMLGPRSTRRPAERLGQWAGRLTGPLFVGPLGRYRAIPAEDVAATLVACADSPSTGVHVHYPRYGRAKELHQ